MREAVEPNVVGVEVRGHQRGVKGKKRALKPYGFIGFGDIHGPKSCELMEFGDIHGPKPYEFIGLVKYMAPNAMN